ncbi:MAG: hypothetical protein K6T17_05355 [Fimbriimonadales bacterium]|nr:hypothetical protein [Fimbriimonadales bacterium]
MTQPQPETAQPSEAQFKKGVFYFWILIVLACLGLLWQAWTIRVLQAEVRQTQENGTLWAAHVFRASVQPLMISRSRGDDGTLQTICENIVSQRAITLAVVSDPTGRVLASSDTNLLNQTLKDMGTTTPSTTWEGSSIIVTLPIMQDNIHLGTIRLKTSPSSR